MALYSRNWRATFKRQAKTNPIAGPVGRVMPKACFQHGDGAAAFGLDSAPALCL